MCVRFAAEARRISKARNADVPALGHHLQTLSDVSPVHALERDNIANSAKGNEVQPGQQIRWV